MKDEVLAHLHDIVQAGTAIRGFAAGRTFGDYTSDEQLRSAVERKFEIIGEALNRLARSRSPVLEKLSDHTRIVGFRNVIAHGYDAVDHEIVWEAVRSYLPKLAAEAEHLLKR